MYYEKNLPLKKKSFKGAYSLSRVDYGWICKDKGSIPGCRDVW
jgi:hypothetical protein